MTRTAIEATSAFYQASPGIRLFRLALVASQRLWPALAGTDAWMWIVGTAGLCTFMLGAYMAIFQLGAVAMPLSMLFGPDALEYRLQDSEAGVAICDESSIANLLLVRDQCPALRTVIGVGAAAIQADLDYELELARQRTDFEATTVAVPRANVRLAAKLTGWMIDIKSMGYVRVASTDLSAWELFAEKVLGLVRATGPTARTATSGGGQTHAVHHRPTA